MRNEIERYRGATNGLTGISQQYGLTSKLFYTYDVLLQAIYLNFKRYKNLKVHIGKIEKSMSTNF